MALAILVIFENRWEIIKCSFIFSFAIFTIYSVPLVKHLGETSGDYNKYGLSEYLVKGLILDSFQQLVNITRFVTDKGYSWERTLLRVLDFFIPRSIWQTKPTNLGIFSGRTSRLLL